MSVPVNHIGATNFVLAADNPLQSSTCLEPVAVNDKTEMDVGSLGLGTALAVAYDLCSDTGIVNQFNTNASLCSSNPQLTSFLSLSALKSPTSQISTHCRNTSLSDQYTYVYSNYFTNNSWLSQHSDGYLTPISSISSISDCPNSIKSLPTDIDPSKAISSSGGFVNKINHLSHVTFVNSEYQPTGVVCSIGDVTPSHNNNHNHNINSNTHTSKSNTVSYVQTNSTNLTENEGPVVKQKTTSNNYDNVLKETINTSHVTSSSALSIDDSLYQLSEEEIKEIDTSLTTNADLMASRQWKYYIETNEWTRATCALMACLFTRDQMANSTVLGRGGSQRARLPSNLVSYVVTTIHRRFNKPAAAVRARMAQKCKDERRFGRLPNSNGNSYIDGNFDTNAPSPVAAISSCRSGTRKARKRAANSISTSSSSHSLNGGNMKQSCTPNYNIYQMNIINDDCCSSTTDSNQLPPISLSPNGVSLNGGGINDDVNGDFDCILQTPIDDSFSVLDNHSDVVNYSQIYPVTTISSPSSSSSTISNTTTNISTIYSNALVNSNNISNQCNLSTTSCISTFSSDL
ncbi:hypothetical protein MN116_002528 [Schistosoma mekongi]|uniref:BEN domain-containing protein n=1 Tax=Schistosoma mekongi TaxID=38744 RepID=A0AAE2D8I5_SCHME|nr:hypothetical protein MN116_002528 [Schistosoma mekongi]